MSTFPYEGWKAQVRHSALSDGFDLHLYRKGPNGKIEVLQFGVPTVITIEEGKEYAPVSLSFGREMMKALAQEMNSLGFRTDRDAMIEGELKATKDHLTDMRRLVFEPAQQITQNISDLS